MVEEDQLRIPDTYYVDWSNQHEDFQEEVTVYPRHKHSIEIDVEIPGSELMCVTNVISYSWQTIFY